MIKTPAGKRKMLLLPVLLLLALAACAPGSGQTSSTLNNVPSGTGATPEPGTDGTAQPAPDGHSESIIATSDLAFIGSDNHMLYAISPKDGTVRWQYKMGDSVWVYAVANGVVYAVAGSMLYALNTSNGALLWKYQATQQLSQVLVSNGLVYADTAATSQKSTLAALNAATGALLWQNTMTTVTPALQGVIDGVVYEHEMIGDPGNPDFQETINALRASDGHLLWQASLNGTDGEAEGAPVTANGMVYFATSYGAVYAFDTTTGQLRWHASQTSERPFAPLSSTPVVVNGLVYVGDGQGISAYRASDGARQWQYPMIAPGPFLPQTVVVDGVLYSANTNGQVVALRASDGTVIWQQHAPGPGIVPSLVVSDGLVISDAGPVFALRASDGTMVWQSALSPSGEGSSAGLPEAVSAGVVYIGGDNGTVTALQASSGNQLWHYAIKELPVQMPPVYHAFVTFAPTVSYQQALEIVTNLGLKTFVLCHPQSWIAGDEKNGFSDGYALTVAATVNAAPLWLGRLKTMPGVTDVQSADGPMSCPIIRPDNGPQYLPQNQAGTFVRVTFTSATAYAAALGGVNALGFRLADPCYEQARAQGKKPTWHPMSEADAFTQAHALVLSTTEYNAVIWATQLKGVAGFVTAAAPFKPSC